MPNHEMFDWDYYSILGVKPDATTAEIKSAWRRLQKIVHPDRAVPGDEADRKNREETSKRVNNAWQVLGNENTRREYDAYRARQVRTAPGPGPAAPPTPRRGPRPGGIDIDIDLEDLLRRARRAQPPKQDRRSPHGPKPEPEPQGPSWSPGYEPPRRPHPGPGPDPGYEPPRRSHPGRRPERRDPAWDWDPNFDLPPLRSRPGAPQPSPTDRMRPRGPGDRPPDDPGRRPKRAVDAQGPWIDERPGLGTDRLRRDPDRLRPDPDWIRKEQPHDFRARPEHALTRDGDDREQRRQADDQRRPADDGGLEVTRNRQARRQPLGTASAPPVRGAGRPVGGHRPQPPGADRSAPGRA